jgi:hypothetical protein
MNKLFRQLRDEQSERQSRPGSTKDMGTIRVAQAVFAAVQFSLWSLRRRVGQIVPVGLAFLLLVCTMQSIGALHDTSSVLTRQKIAQNWRTPYDLFVRPQSSVSQPERDAGWIDPQSALEDYGGISLQQVASISVLPHVAQVSPFANIGWQSIDVQVPVGLVPRGIYRVSASWIGEGVTGNEIVRYVDITDLTHLTSETPLSSPVLEHLIALNDRTPVVFPMSVQGIQAVIGVPMAQKATLSQVLFEDIPPAATVHLSLHVDKLLGDIATLPGCVKRGECWEAQQVRLGAIQYQVDGVQLLRYSGTNYTATPQQLAAGQVSVAPIGEDMQGLLYRTPLVTHVAFPASGGNENTQEAGYGYLQRASPFALPVSGPERLPLMANAVHFIPLEQACAVNGASCYSGLYVRLNGVERYSQQSLALLQATAAAITTHTGLHVDILDGSSLRSVSLSSSTDSGTLVRSSWRVVGVAVQIVRGVDALQQTLLVFCSIVCLLAIGAAGALVGIGRRKDALLLQQLGWSPYLLLCILALDALILSLPGCLLAVSWIMLASAVWRSSLPPVILWILFIGGLIAYCSLLICTARLGTTSFKKKVTRIFRQFSIVIPTLICSVAITAAEFLIAMEYMLVASFNQVLVVTVLGNQVREALEVPQLLLLLLILMAALLTVALCVTLLLQGRREEILLLSMVGWERRSVLLRIMWDCWWPALLSGEAGGLLALGVTMLGGELPPLFIIVGLLLCAPLAGVVLVSLAAIGPAWQETKRVFLWK